MEERKITAQKESEIGDALAQLESTRREVRELEAERDRHAKHHVFLQQFQKQHSEEFGGRDLYSVIERYRTLWTVHGDLQDEQRAVAADLDAVKRQLQRAQKAAATQSLTNEGLVTRMKERIEAARHTALSLAQGADESLIRRGKRTGEIEQVLQAISNVHARCLNSPFGQILKHNPRDAAVLGFTVNLPGDEEDDSDSKAGSSAQFGSGTAGGGSNNSPGGAVSSPQRRRQSGLASGGAGESLPLMSPMAASGGGFSARRENYPASGDDSGLDALGGSGRSDSASSSPQVGSSAQQGQGQAAAPYKPPQFGDPYALSPAELRSHVKTAVGLLQVVSSFIQDYESISQGYPEWRHEQLRKREERMETLRLEMAKLEAARAARNTVAAPGGASPPRPKGHGGAAGAGGAKAGAVGAGGAGASGTQRTHGGHGSEGHTLSSSVVLDFSNAALLGLSPGMRIGGSVVLPKRSAAAAAADGDAAHHGAEGGADGALSAGGSTSATTQALAHSADGVQPPITSKHGDRIYMTRGATVTPTLLRQLQMGKYTHAPDSLGGGAGGAGAAALQSGLTNVLGLSSKKKP
jgi:hypothetical protein